MSLGFGTGLAFIPSPAGDGLDFDFPNFDTPPTSSALPIVALGQDTLDFSGGIQSTGSETYQFRIDVPDLVGASAGGVFTLRQVPGPVPEPTTMALLAIAGVGLALYRRTR
jgi:hypothetical protein